MPTQEQLAKAKKYIAQPGLTDESSVDAQLEAVKRLRTVPISEPDVTPPAVLAQSPYLQAAQLTEQANAPKPDPFQGMTGWKRILAQGMLGAAEGSIHANDPGGYNAYLERESERDYRGRQDLLSRAKELRGEGMAQSQMHQQDVNAQLNREQQMEIANRPQFKEFGTAAGGYLYGNVDPTTGTFTQQGEIPGTSQAAAQTDKNIGNYINKAGHHVEIFQKPDGSTYEKPFGEVQARQGVGLTPGSYGESNIVNRLVQQWDKASKDVTDLYRANTIMQSGLDAARRGDLNAGSQAVLITFQKFLDPQSVVRESEYARSAEGLSMANRISGFIERLQQGGAGVTLPELETFAKLAQEINANLAREGNSLLAKQADRIRRNAQHYGIPEDLIFSGYDFKQNPVQPQGPGAPPPSAGTQPKTMILGDKTLTLGQDGKYH